MVLPTGHCIDFREEREQMLCMLYLQGTCKALTTEPTPGDTPFFYLLACECQQAQSDGWQELSVSRLSEFSIASLQDNRLSLVNLLCRVWSISFEQTASSNGLHSFFRLRIFLRFCLTTFGHFGTACSWWGQGSTSLHLDPGPNVAWMAAL